VNGTDYGGITINGRWQLGAGAGNSADVNIGGANILHFKDSATAFIDTGVSSPLQLRPQGVVAMRLNTDQSIDVYERMTIFGTNVASSGTIPPFSITKTYNQTATAGSTDLLINRTETALGSGTHYFADFQVGGTSVFSVDNRKWIVRFRCRNYSIQVFGCGETANQFNNGNDSRQFLTVQ
jgi:hypothetical protein